MTFAQAEALLAQACIDYVLDMKRLFGEHRRQMAHSRSRSHSDKRSEPWCMRWPHA